MIGKPAPHAIGMKRKRDPTTAKTSDREKVLFSFFLFLNIVCDTQVMHSCILKKKSRANALNVSCTIDT